MRIHCCVSKRLGAPGWVRRKFVRSSGGKTKNSDSSLPAWTPGLLDAVWEQPSVLIAPLLLNFEFFFSQLTTRMYHRSPKDAIFFFGISGRDPSGSRPGPGRDKRTRPGPGRSFVRDKRISKLFERRAPSAWETIHHPRDDASGCQEAECRSNWHQRCWKRILGPVPQRRCCSDVLLPAFLLPA